MAEKVTVEKLLTATGNTLSGDHLTITDAQETFNTKIIHIDSDKIRRITVRVKSIYLILAAQNIVRLIELKIPNANLAIKNISKSAKISINKTATIQSMSAEDGTSLSTELRLSAEAGDE